MKRTLILSVALAVLYAGSANAATIATWGGNEYGQLGDSRTSAEQHYSDLPVGVNAGEVTSLASGDGGEYNPALLSNGTVESWGNNYAGQLGLGTYGGEHDSPTVIPNLANVTAISAGCELGMALLSNGEVREWGNFPASSDTPTNPGLTEVKAIAAGQSCGFAGYGGDAYALKSNGTVQAWGNDKDWQLGYETNAGRGGFSSITPHQVEGVTNVAEIAAGFNFAQARTNSGEVIVWGGDQYGQHGNGTVAKSEDEPCILTGTLREVATERDQLPSAVSGLGTVAHLSAGGHTAFALLASGELRSWGSNGNGALGSGTPERESTLSAVPVKVDVPSASAVSGGSGTNLALSGGALYAWGSNENGALATGSIEGPEGSYIPHSATPVEVHGLSGTVKLSRGVLASAPAPSVYSLAGWVASGTLSTNGVGTVKPSGTFNGSAALHGQLDGNVAFGAFTAKLKNVATVSFTLSLNELRRTLDESVKASTGGTLNITSVSLSPNPNVYYIDVSCHASITAPLGGTFTPEHVGLSGPVTVGPVTCDHYAEQRMQAPLLTEWLSGSQSFTLALNA